MQLNETELDLFMKQCLNIGEGMFGAGAEISRIEDTLGRLCHAYGAELASIYVITSSIVITMEFSDAPSMTQSRRIRREDAMDLTRLEKFNDLSRRCSKDPLPVRELKDEVNAILSSRSQSPTITLAGEMLAAGSFAVFFGGHFGDGIAAACMAFLIWILQKHFRPLCSGTVFFNIVTSFVIGSLICVLSHAVGVLDRDQIMIGAIMVLIPGISITNAIRYSLSGDTISGVEKLITSVLSACAIAAGFTLAILFAGRAIG